MDESASIKCYSENSTFTTTFESIPPNTRLTLSWLPMPRQCLHTDTTDEHKHTTRRLESATHLWIQ